ncbi:MAG: glycogen/starch synthase [Sandaracinaceae bacterium]|nr:glycogen/starch synthase [Sandaracinaceae bacterium]
MEILIVTPELIHYRGRSSISESAGALAKALRSLGHGVEIVSPLWGAIDPGERHLARRLTQLEVEVDGKRYVFSVYEGRSTAGVDLTFLGEASLFPHLPTQSTDELGALRWGAFARAVLALLRHRSSQAGSLPEVIHHYGWQTGMLPSLLSKDKELATIPTVFSVHELRDKGIFERDLLGVLGFTSDQFAINGVEFYGKVSLLKAGLLYSTRVIAPSPSLAKRFLVDAGGGGLEGVLRSRGSAFLGIAEGVDVSIWNPASDPHVDVRFDAIEMGTSGLAKLRNKNAFQRDLGLPIRGDLPLTIAWLRNRPDEEIFERVLHRLVLQPASIVVLSESALPERVKQLAKRFPDRLVAHGEASDALLHRALGAAELCILPALDDPFGIIALQAQRYGALPIARAHGLVADTVVDLDAHLQSGTGFLFDEATEEAFFGTCMRAFGSYRQRLAFRHAAQRAMRCDHSWEKSARAIEQIYRSLNRFGLESAA